MARVTFGAVPAITVAKAMMALPTDENLLAESARGDADAFGTLASRYGGMLDAYFRRRLPDDGRVEELRQDTLLALFSLLPSYRERGRFRSLVFTIAYRKLASELRGRPAAEPLADDLADRSTGGEERVAIRAALASISDGLREALLLTALDGLSSAEAGEVLGCSGEAVRARVCRARSALALALSHDPKRRRHP
jgi:RNA polymerase sigma-70 factor (ECF subfamily)